MRVPHVVAILRMMIITFNEETQFLIYMRAHGYATLKLPSSLHNEVNLHARFWFNFLSVFGTDFEAK